MIYRRAVAFMIKWHGPGPALLQRQARLAAIKRLNLALFVVDSTMAWPADRT